MVHVGLSDFSGLSISVFGSTIAGRCTMSPHYFSEKLKEKREMINLILRRAAFQLQHVQQKFGFFQCTGPRGQYFPSGHRGIDL